MWVSTTQHQGHPRKNGKSKPYGHGWFMLVNPKDLRVLGVTCMEKAENNPVVRGSLLKILSKYKNLDGFVMDRACGFAPSVKTDQALKQIKFWAVDHFHALEHKKTCKYNPLHVTRLGKRFKGVNLSAAEQVFSWFRNYARLLNEARPERHAFKVLYFVKQHNQNLQDKATYLNKYQASFKKGSKKYACNSKVIKNMKAAKTMKHMKSIKAMKSAKGTKAMKSMKK